MLALAIAVNGQKHIKLTFKVESICSFNDDYNSIDTNFVLIDGSFVKVWNKYDDFFKIYDSDNDKWTLYLTDHLRNKKISYDLIDTNRYIRTDINQTSKVLGYKCNEASLVSPKDTLIAFYTGKFGVNYSPGGNVGGFALQLFN